MHTAHCSRLRAFALLDTAPHHHCHAIPNPNSTNLVYICLQHAVSSGNKILKRREGRLNLASFWAMLLTSSSPQNCFCLTLFFTTPRVLKLHYSTALNFPQVFREFLKDEPEEALVSIQSFALDDMNRTQIAYDH